MITLEMMINKLKDLGNDVSWDYMEHSHRLYVTLEDFEGFDYDWAEKFRDYDNPQAVEEFEDWLDECANNASYPNYQFDGFTLHLSYASDDI